MHTLQGYSDLDLQARLTEAATQHPRLAIHAAALPTDPALLRRADAFVPVARSLLDVPVLERIQTGRRLLSVSREALHRLSVLSVAWMRTQDPVFLRRAEAELTAVCGFTDWNPSHYLDTAEMSLGVALAYDWLHGALSPDVREATADGLWRLGLQTALTNESFWVRSHHNWGQVCHAGMTAAALALADRHPEAAFKVIKRAFHNLPIAMAAYEPDGVYPEGATYWEYGTGFNVAFLLLVESALGTSYGLAEQPGFAETVQFLLHVTGPTGEFFNFADCGRGPRRSDALPWFSARFGIPLPDDSPEAHAFLRDPSKSAKSRMAPLLFVFGASAPKFAPAATTQTLDWHGRGGSEFAAFRSGWTRDAWYLAVKGGTPRVNHGHMDVGSFVLEAHGQRWADEAGAEDYHALESKGYGLWKGEQDGERWGVFRYGPESHNYPVVNGQRQRVDAAAVLEVVDLQGESPSAVLDLSAMYGLPVQRRFVFERRASVAVTDTFEALPAGVPVRWQMLTRADVETEGSTMVLRRGGKEVRIEKDVAAEWKVEEASALLNPWDSALPGFRRIRFEVPAPADGRLRWTVRFL